MTDNQTVLVIAAHPDDAEFGAAGTVSRWTSEGRRVVYVICTNGDKGTADRQMTPQRLAAIRQEEQRAAAKMIGVDEVVFLGYTDGYLDYTDDLREKLVRCIRRYRPYTVLTSDPYRKYFWHHDHRVAGQVVLDAVYPYARDHLFYPEQLKEGLSTHHVREVLLWGTDDPDTFFDISDYFDLKIAALRCHVSQVGGKDELREWVGNRARDNGMKAGMKLAEAFHRVELPL